jgi:nicotinamide-nucleotide amidase
MIVEVIAVGTELLLGQVVNTNATWLGSRIADEGWDALHQQVVGDNRGRLVDAIRVAIDRADAVILTGGIGPTQDDLTREAIAEATGRPLQFNEELGAELAAWWQRRFGREMPVSNFRQAEYPEGAEQYPNPRGTAPGIGLRHEGTWVFALPGVPPEMQGLFDEHVAPRIRAHAGDLSVIVSRVLHSWGIPESTLGEQLDDLFTASTNPSLAFLASSAVIKVRITAKGRTEAEAEDLIRPVEEEVRRRLGAAVFAVDRETLPGVVLDRCRRRGWTLAAAESMTGGLLGGRITEEPGSSDVFVGGVVAYDARRKHELLGVDSGLLEAHGQVSEPVALAMADGVSSRLATDVGVAITGVAGPDGLEGVEPGTVVIAVRTPEGARARTLRMPGDRERARTFSVTAALQLTRLAVVGEWW